jgi:hypothetical protein
MPSRVALYILLVALGGCATVFNAATNEPLSAATPTNMGAPTDVMRENSIVLSFSGCAPRLSPTACSPRWRASRRPTATSSTTSRSSAGRAAKPSARAFADYLASALR